MFSDVPTITAEKIRLCHNLLKIGYVFIFSKVVAFRKCINPKFNKNCDKRQNLRPWLKCCCSEIKCWYDFHKDNYVPIMCDLLKLLQSCLLQLRKTLAWNIKHSSTLNTVLVIIKLTKFEVALQLHCGSCKLIFWHYFIIFC